MLGRIWVFLFLGIFVCSGCTTGSGKTNIAKKNDNASKRQDMKKAKLKPLKGGSKTQRVKVIFNPAFDLYVTAQNRVFIEEFKNTSNYQAAGTVMRDAFVHIFLDSLYEFADSKENGDCYIGYEVQKVVYKPLGLGLRSAWIAIADGPSGRMYNVTVEGILSVSTKTQQYKGKVTLTATCKEHDVASAVNFIGICAAKAVVRSMKTSAR